MLQRILIVLVIIISINAVAQKPQRIGYIDMEYILENVPEYKDAQARLNVKVASWQQSLDGLKREIELMKTDLSNEKPLLTYELIAEREEDIQIKEEDLKKLQVAYFGTTGDLYLLRKQLVQPVQDQIYNAVQNIAVSKKYDIILDKSSDLIMLYSNNKFDVSELVLNRIVKGRKKVQLEDKKSERQIRIDKAAQGIQTKINEKESKREALLAKIKLQQEARSKRREEIKQAAADKRKKRLEEIEKRRKNLENKKNVDVKSKTDSTFLKTPDSLQTISTKKFKDSIKNSKRQALLDRIKKQKEAKAKKREEIKQAAADKRKKRLEEIEKRRQKLIESKTPKNKKDSITNNN
jgi:Skp family chaperone for outer membrane proteins